MNPRLIRLTKDDYVVSQWSGGTTTQLAIVPRDAQYGDRTFIWRLSSATVDLDESDFTQLPDYNRLIAPLRGEMTLTHDGGEPIILRPYQVHAFDGGANTHSEGRCVDFNLMLRKGACQGRVFPVECKANQSVCLETASSASEVLLYCVKGLGRISFCCESAELYPGDTVWVYAPAAGALKLECRDASVFMAAELYDTSESH